MYVPYRKAGLSLVSLVQHAYRGAQDVESLSCRGSATDIESVAVVAHRHRHSSAPVSPDGDMQQLLACLASEGMLDGVLHEYLHRHRRYHELSQHLPVYSVAQRE